MTASTSPLAPFIPAAACCALVVFSLFSSAQAEPVTQPTSRPSVTALADTPSGAFHQYLRALNVPDRKAALECWNTIDPKESKIAELQVDMMLAVSRLKKAVRSKFGAVAPFDLQMAVVGEDECGAIKEQVTADTASIEVHSTDEQQAPRSYSMVRSAGRWKLSAAEELKNQPTNAPLDMIVAAGRNMVQNITSAADAVEKGQLHNVDDVQRKIF